MKGKNWIGVSFQGMVNLLVLAVTLIACPAAEASPMSPEAAKLCRNAEELKGLEELYSVMNPADSADHTPEFYLENCIRPALQAREEMPWGKDIPEREFKYFVLPLRVNNEAIDGHRPLFYAELRDRVNKLSMEDAILEINHWCHEKATYQPSDGRTHSPLQTVSSAIGRCGEESTFGVAALRAMGIPARQVYTPRWAHTDDNHAWVEAWANGRWYYLGACEPEAVLDHGWFDAPATRGMLMHARVPGEDYDGPEEVLMSWQGNTDINVTSNYAPVDTLRVKVLTRDGLPASGAKVSFRLYNYAEFYPLVTKTADAEGGASIVAGLGDLIIWAQNGHDFGFAKGSVGKDHEITVKMLYDGDSRVEADFDLVPPVDRAKEVIVPGNLQEENRRRLAREDSIRNAYVSGFPSEDDIKSLAVRLNAEANRVHIDPKQLSDKGNQFIIDANELGRLITLSRGNSETIIDFLIATPVRLRPKAMRLLASLTEKDLTDVTEEVLSNSMTAPDIVSPLYDKYILSPRIGNEALTPFRKYFTTKFEPEDIERYRKDPSLWVNYVGENIVADRDWYPEQATMSPVSTGELRHTSAKSRDIYFVAGARSFGIPARIDPVTGKPQYADASCRWIDARFVQPQHISDPSSAESLQGVVYGYGDIQQSTDPVENNMSTLHLRAAPNPIVPDPKYYANFTISRIVDGEPQLLEYPDFMENSKLFGNRAEIEKGQYAIVTGQRMADGSVLARLQITTVGDEACVDTLRVRQDASGVQIIGSFNSENLFRPFRLNRETESDDFPGKEEPVSILSQTGRGYFVVGVIRSGDEPSNHALRDIAAVGDEIEKLGLPIVLLFESEADAAKMDFAALPKLPSTTILGIDPDGSIAREIVSNLALAAPSGESGSASDTAPSPTSKPIFIIADTFNRVIFVRQGYTIGLGTQLLDTLRRI